MVSATTGLHHQLTAYSRLEAIMNQRSGTIARAGYKPFESTVNHKADVETFVLNIYPSKIPYRKMAERSPLTTFNLIKFYKFKRQELENTMVWTV